MTHLKNNLRAIQLIAILMFTVLSVPSAQAQTPKKSDVAPRGSVASGQRPAPPRLFPWRLAPDTSHLTPAAGPNLPVFGSGTLGRLTKWAGFTSSSSTIGNSTIFEDKFGLVGIGTDSPTSKLTVLGMIQTTMGGFKFPDGTVQTTAGLFSVFHNATLAGNGTQASPLGVAIPLTLEGDGSAMLNAVNLGSGIGVDGFAVANSGVRGIAIGGTGVDGRSENGNGLSGFSTNGFGMRAQSINSVAVIATSDTNIGVFAQGGIVDNGIAPEGLQAKGGRSATNGGAGVDAIGGNGNNSPGHGVVATGGHVGGSGVFARGSNETSGNNPGGDGVRAIGGTGSGALHGGGNGITAIAGGGSNGASSGLAGQFVGSVLISGDLNVQGTKNFKIDHPLDPENKYLLHAAIESSEVLNIYSGNVTTNENGEAMVTLPDWFEAMNRDLRYQLTVIGTFAQAIVAEKVRQNRFGIKTSAPNTEVSWQVTGVRSDAAMQKHPFKAEEEKPVRERRLARP